jgi:hypothetical protein
VTKAQRKIVEAERARRLERRRTVVRAAVQRYRARQREAQIYEVTPA